MTKENKHCPINDKFKCNSDCGLYMIGMKACVFHGINANLGDLVKVTSKP